jgi:PDZ domain-containing protein
VSNQTTPAPPASPAPPTPTPSDAWARPPARRVSRWWWVLLVAVVAFFAVAFAGFWVHLPYYTISPGGEVAIGPRIDVQGATEYPADGEVLLLFVRERARVNLWQYVQARIDPDIDLFREREFTGGRTPEQVRQDALAAMVESQLVAKKVALETIGYELPLEGAEVFSTLRGTPAARLLEPEDLIVSVDGRPIRALDDLGEVVSAHEPGERVT